MCSESEHFRVDTVFLRHTEFRYRYLHDTIRIARIDSIPYPVEVIREVPSPIPRAYRYSLWFTISAIICFILYVFLRLYLRKSP